MRIIKCQLVEGRIKARIAQARVHGVTVLYVHQMMWHECADNGNMGL
ncbi:hypothetical protein MKC54_02870 [[Clostridium] innocuum]|nr:hypothetical protein [[Clostridium] innocuum]MCR0575818.1 hypothetical protein [[Clostridium] innocuum]